MNVNKKINMDVLIVDLEDKYAVGLLLDKKSDLPIVSIKANKYFIGELKTIANSAFCPIVEDDKLAFSLYNIYKIGVNIESRFFKEVAEIYTYVNNLGSRDRIIGKNDFKNLLTFELVTINVGIELYEKVFNTPEFLRELKLIKSKFTAKIGYILPMMAIKQDKTLNSNEYILNIRNKMVSSNKVDLKTNNILDQISSLFYKYKVELFTLTEFMGTLYLLEEKQPMLVNMVSKKYSLDLVFKICKNLLEDDIYLTDLLTVYELILTFSQNNYPYDLLYKKIKKNLIRPKMIKIKQKN
ncbi:MAG: FHIPEP family type III secretion protein [Campylobacterota bacterium]|nr:FHIPEP family type III secretion protein [Campylobacterota bacterium]